MAKIYLMGSLRNPQIPSIANRLRREGYDVFDDWFAVGPEADDYWQRYEAERGRTYAEALSGKAAVNTFKFDYSNLLAADIGVLALPAGKSAHMELGWMIGKGKRGFVLFDAVPERWDCMYQFADDVFFDIDDLVAAL